MTLKIRRVPFYLAIAFSSLLLFSIQPIMTKAILPTFGGTAGVWVTAMLFFQTMLLMGYLYSYLLTRFFSRRTQSTVHLALLLFSLLLLPVKPHLELAAQGSAQGPESSIVLILVASVGLPYFLLSSTSPLLQSWFVTSYAQVFPYRLFALSNAGSVLALLAYPILVEPFLAAGTQLRFWSVGYALLVAIAGLTAVLHWSASPIQEPLDIGGSARRPLLWIALGAWPRLYGSRSPII